MNNQQSNTIANINDLNTQLDSLKKNPSRSLDIDNKNILPILSHLQFLDVIALLQVHHKLWRHLCGIVLGHHIVASTLLPTPMTSP